MYFKLKLLIWLLQSGLFKSENSHKSILSVAFYFINIISKYIFLKYTLKIWKDVEGHRSDASRR